MFNVEKKIRRKKKKNTNVGGWGRWIITHLSPFSHHFRTNLGRKQTPPPPHQWWAWPHQSHPQPNTSTIQIRLIFLSPSPFSPKIITTKRGLSILSSDSHPFRSNNTCQIIQP